MRGENSHGISVPSGLSTVGKTLGAESGVVPQSELAAARAVLSGKVIIDLASRFATYRMCVVDLYRYKLTKNFK